MTIDKIQLGEYATLAERIAHERAAAAETLLQMNAEAKRIQIELGDALFDPYVGMRLVGEYRDKPEQCFTLFRAKHYHQDLHLFAFDIAKDGYGTQPGGPPRYDYPQGWVVTVEWKPAEQRMQASMQRVCETAGSQKTFSGGTGDIGTQAVALAQALAQEIGERLLIEKEATK